MLNCSLLLLSVVWVVVIVGAQGVRLGPPTYVKSVILINHTWGDIDVTVYRKLGGSSKVAEAEEKYYGVKNDTCLEIPVKEEDMGTWRAAIPIHKISVEQPGVPALNFSPHEFKSGVTTGMMIEMKKVDTENGPELKAEFLEESKIATGFVKSKPIAGLPRPNYVKSFRVVNNGNHHLNVTAFYSQENENGKSAQKEVFYVAKGSAVEVPSKEIEKDGWKEVVPVIELLMKAPMSECTMDEGLRFTPKGQVEGVVDKVVLEIESVQCDCPECSSKWSYKIVETEPRRPTINIVA